MMKLHFFLEYAVADFKPIALEHDKWHDGTLPYNNLVMRVWSRKILEVAITKGSKIQTVEQWEAHIKATLTAQYGKQNIKFLSARMEQIIPNGLNA